MSGQRRDEFGNRLGFTLGSWERIEYLPAKALTTIRNAVTSDTA